MRMRGRRLNIYRQSTSPSPSPSLPPPFAFHKIYGRWAEACPDGRGRYRGKRQDTDGLSILQEQGRVTGVLHSVSEPICPLDVGMTRAC